METITRSKLEIKAEISRINEEIANWERTMNDYRLMQTGEFNKYEIKCEIAGLIKERNSLLSEL